MVCRVWLKKQTKQQQPETSYNPLVNLTPWISTLPTKLLSLCSGTRINSLVVGSIPEALGAGGVFLRSGFCQGLWLCPESKRNAAH